MRVPRVRITVRGLMGRLRVRSRKARVVLRVAGYGSLIFVLVMSRMRLESQIGYGVTSMLVGTPALVGPACLVLLMCQPEVSGREGWMTCVVLWLYLFASVIPILRMD
jgi:hypothetical protein